MIRVSAPGKAILMGEHAAVYGRPALVAALDRRVHVRLEGLPESRQEGVREGAVELDLPGLGIRRRDGWTDLLEHAERVRGAWQRLRDHTDAAGAEPARNTESGQIPEFARITGEEDRSHLVRIALGEAVHALEADARARIRRRHVSLRIHSEFPVGSGFGSSASIAVAVVRAVFELAGQRLDAERLHAVSLEVERRQHGAPSGVDNATVIHGGVLWVERKAADRPSSGSGLQVTPVATGSEAAESIFRRLRIYQTGEPAESTGEVVSAVRALRDRDEAAFAGRLKVMEETSRTFRDLLEGPHGADDGLFRAIDAMRRFESCLEALGVVPQPVQEHIRRIEEAGGAAKVSGAGSLAGPGAGSLLVLHPRPEILGELDALRGYERLEVRLGGDGLRVESTADPAE